MNPTSDQTALRDKLMAPVSSIVNRHSATILPLLKGGSGELTHAALKNDENVRKVATFCYPLLPGLVRLAVNEPAFVNFVMNNRERILDRLVPATQSGAA